MAALSGGRRPSGLPSAGDAPRARFARARRSCSHLDIAVAASRLPAGGAAVRVCVYKWLCKVWHVLKWVL